MGFSVFSVRSSRPRPQEPHDIPINFGGEEIAYLCLLKGISAQVSALTGPQRAVLEHERNGMQLESDAYYFKSDYVAVQVDHLVAYDGVRKTTSFWGQYLHDSDAPADSSEIFRDDEVICADVVYSAPTPRHAESLSKYASYGRPPDRFLFLYHFLELDFDREVVKRIKSLSDESLNGVGQIIRELGGGDELGRLNHIIRDIPVADIQELAGLIKRHASVSKGVFYEYGKDANPVKDYEDFKAYFLNTSAVREHIFRDHKLSNKINFDFAKNFESNLRRCVAYWIYRVRCCVAHNKLGEYHLMTSDDMKFLEEFAIPLLRAIVKFRMSC